MGHSIPGFPTGNYLDPGPFARMRLPDFRRPLNRALERGKSVHALQRQIRTQPLPAKRGPRPEELIATSGAQTLPTNYVMAWNTQRLQRRLSGDGPVDRSLSAQR